VDMHATKNGWRRAPVLAFLLAAGLILPRGTAAADAGDEQARVELAIGNGLKWLAARQAAEGPEAGSWATDEARYRTAVTSLAGLAFLANGYVPGDTAYGRVVERAMAYVKPTMAPDGYLGQGDRSGMYIHAICTLFGLSTLGMSSRVATDAELAEWCRKSVRVIEEAQKVSRLDFARGGWRYTPSTDESDVSVTSWQVLVLHAARQCGYEVDEDGLDAAMRFINGAYREQEAAQGGLAGFVYRPGVSQDPEPGATGAALFVKSLIERQADRRVLKSLSCMERFPPTWGGEQYRGYFFFSSFYMTQGMFQVGDDAWKRYIIPMRRLLLEHQAGDGSWPYPPDDMRQGQLAGPAYPTAMAVLILSLEKQYLPMYQRQAAMFR
jgi:hypothetical protein